jgi:hypothetical protein
MSRTSDIQWYPGFVAASDLSSNQYYVVEPASTAAQCKVVNATTDEAIGLLQNDPKAGQAAAIAVGGVAKGIAGTSVGWTDGVDVGYNTTGKCVPIAVNGTNDNRRVIGKFYQRPGQTTTVTANQILSILVSPGARRL